MFVQLTTTDGMNVAVNPMAIAVIMERDAEVTAIETTDGNEYTVAEGFRDVKVKLESALNERYRRQQINH
ncbi:MAG: hypothetical protein Q9O74_09025 [Planctomycetota bacterium]|nr:hypothetical protein [Planctomycetota bacterium]